MDSEELRLQRARITNDELLFEMHGGLDKALRDGFFLLGIPADLDLTPGTTLCREFYRPPAPPEQDARLAGYRGYRDLEGVYFDREHFQTEHVLIDGPERERRFPLELRRMTARMHALAIVVLRSVLADLDVPEHLWGRVTGGAVEGDGTEWFAANHYRPERALLGCAPHKDTGFVTVLYIEQEGLEAAAGSSWASIDPVPGYFVVNFGGAFELLTAELTRTVKAVLHRVRRCEPDPDAGDRFSFAAFVNPPAAGDLHQMNGDGTARVVRSAEEFLRDFNEETWADRHADFGIASSSEPGVPEGSVLP